jgi:hypothetical protein
MMASEVIRDLKAGVDARGDFEVQVLYVNSFGEKVMCEVAELRPFGRDLVVRPEKSTHESA